MCQERKANNCVIIKIVECSFIIHTFINFNTLILQNNNDHHHDLLKLLTFQLHHFLLICNQSEMNLINLFH